MCTQLLVRCFVHSNNIFQLLFKCFSWPYFLFELFMLEQWASRNLTNVTNEFYLPTNINDGQLSIRDRDQYNFISSNAFIKIFSESVGLFLIVLSSIFFLKRFQLEAKIRFNKRFCHRKAYRIRKKKTTVNMNIKLS